jgi:hypothetical protein
MNCPVCGALAQDITVQTFDGKSIRCPACGDYDIVGTVYDSGIFERSEPAQRLRALDSAKKLAPEGKRPVITSYDT